MWRILRNAAMKMLSATIAHAFMRWHEHLLEESGMKNKMRRVLGMMCNRRTCLAFSRWVEHMDETKSLLRKSSKIVGRWLHR